MENPPEDIDYVSLKTIASLFIDIDVITDVFQAAQACSYSQKAIIRRKYKYTKWQRGEVCGGSGEG